VHRESARGQLHRHGRGERRLADAAFAHQHDQTVAFCCDVIDQRSQAGGLDFGRIRWHIRRRQCAGLGVQQLFQGRQPKQIKRLEFDLIRGQVAQDFRQVSQHRLFALEDGLRQRVMHRFRLRKHAIDYQILPGQPDARQFAVRARGFIQCRCLRTRHQDQAGSQGVSQRIHRRRVLRALLVQSGQGPQAGGIALALCQETAPGTGQLQHADGVAGGRGVKNDVVKILRQHAIRQ